MDKYDVIVIGAGHAGIEAALACARMECRTLLVTLRKERIGFMSCNPAIGGVGKGQLVKEIDALGGHMAKAADLCGIQFRVLNASKGPAVQSSRAQEDREQYSDYMGQVVNAQANLEILEAEVTQLVIRDGVCLGVKTKDGLEVLAQTTIIAVGTFLNGLIHIGLNHFPGGRIDEEPTLGLSEYLKKIGFNVLRFKTGTCPRIDRDSIDFSKLTIQEGDRKVRPFSFSTKSIKTKQHPCYITYTNHKTHKIIQDNLSRSPLYAGVIKATGVRYCPSIEDKIVKFPDRSRHQVFLEPEGVNSNQIYPNGLATSLPEDVQLKMLHSVEGLEKARVLKFGYGIEHEVVEPTQLKPTLETKKIDNLYLAGQINGTTGYEEAAAQGLLAGINAVLKIKKKKPLILDRSSSYIGVLIDDLVTKGTNEPYRMFTSRVEYRLVLREDNADLRLRKIAFDIGLISKKEYQRTINKQEQIKSGIEYLKKNKIKLKKDLVERIEGFKGASSNKSVTLFELLKRPEVSLKDLRNINNLPEDITAAAWNQVEIEAKYSGFIQRQLNEVEKFKHLEKIKIPDDLEFRSIPSLSREIQEKLIKFRPISLGQASRISGLTPAAISILMIYLRKYNESKANK